MDEEKGVVCPVCFEALEPGVEDCPNCGSTIPEDSAQVLGSFMRIAGVGPKEAKTLLEEGLGVPAEDDEEIEDLLEDISEGKVLYLCPDCGSFLEEDSPLCPGCGRDVPHQSRLEAPPPPADEEGGGLYMCPACGAFVAEDSDTCTNCGAELIEEEPAEEPVESEAEAVPEPEEPAVEETPEVEAPEPAPVLVEEPLEQEEAPEADRFADTVALTDLARMDEEIYICPTCGALVEVDDPRCDICATDLTARRPISAGVTLAATPGGPTCDNCGAVLPEAEATCRICGGEEPAMALDLPKAPAEKVVPPPEVVSLEAEIDSFIEELETPKPEPTPLPVVRPVERPREPAPKPVVKAAPALPKRIVLKPISAPVHRRGRRRASSAVARQLLPRAREFMVYATLVAVGVEYLVSQARPDGYELLMLVLFGALLGTGVGLIAGSAPDFRRRVAQRGPFTLLGTAVMTLVPLRAFLAVPPPFDGFDLLLLGVGGFVVVAGGLVERTRLESDYLWLGGTLLLLLMAATRLAAPGPEAAASSLGWAAGAAMVLVAFLLVLQHKWASATMAESIVTGDRRYRRQDFGGSLQAYERALQAAEKGGSRDNAEVPWYSKGAALVMLDRPAEALVCLERALEINPKSEVAWVNKGTALAKLGRHEEALRCYNAALRLNPTYEVAWNNKANTLARRGKHREAIRCYDEAIRLDQGYRDAWVNKGYVLVQLGDYDGAAECAEHASASPGRRPASSADLSRR